MNTRNILFVDDREGFYQVYEGVLREGHQDWDVYFTSSGEQALKMVQDKPYDLVICDLQMRGARGLKFLRDVSHVSPETNRIAITDKSGEKDILNSLNVVHGYMLKPVNSEQLRESVVQSFAVSDAFHSDVVRHLASSIERVPSLPALYNELLDLLHSDEVSMPDIGRIISADIGMTAKVLKLVNSSFFGLRREILTAEEAVVYLGIEAVKALVLSVHAFSALSARGIPEEYVNELWEHSVTVAAFARCIARFENSDKRLVDSAFTAGMLHDVGKLILMDNMPEQFREYIEALRHDDSSALAVECLIFGATHQEVGAFLMRNWGLSDSIVEPILFHHHPRIWHEEFSVVTAVNAADALYYELVKHDIDAVRLDAAYLKRINMLVESRRWREACRRLLRTSE
jgi:HD-like signal output (HDOD) protein